MAKSTRRRTTKSGAIIKSPFLHLLAPGLKREFELAYRVAEEYPDFIQHVTYQAYSSFWDRIKFTFLIPWI